uniref:Uncharacterized protein n=1 Tax=Rhizophora mucronata TaxID=61149 RepID=A0A2P2QTC9_RHIMU
MNLATALTACAHHYNPQNNSFQKDRILPQ